MAILTAIMRGSETIIVTRDADVLEQYFKVLCLMKEHYRAMLVADRYAASPDTMPFREVPIHGNGVHIPPFSGSTILELETTDAELNPLPAGFHFVNTYCFVLGGEPSSMRTTSCSFCAETEIAQMLKVKTVTGGLNTDKLNGRNCTIHTTALTLENHRVVVSIGKETVLSINPFGSFGIDDLNNTLTENEEHTFLSYRSEP